MPFSYKYTVCTFIGNCNELTAWDYISDPEIYSVYIACAFHFVFWGMALKIADVKKDGGQIFGSNKVGDKVIYAFFKSALTSLNFLIRLVFKGYYF